MRFSSEFRNVFDPNLPGPENVPISPPAMLGGEFRMLPWNDPLPTPDSDLTSPFASFMNRLRDNTAVLTRIVDWLAGRRVMGELALPPGEVPAGIVYIPPGRYYLGRPAVRPASETGADLVIPADITLRFAPGATLVLMNYEVVPADLRPPDARQVIPGRPEYGFLVRMEIQGRIDAGAYPIFDVLMERPDDAAAQQGTAATLHRAGHVDLTRNTTREVYPEWFGASPPPGDFSNGLPSGVVHRTRLAMQEAIDVAHTRRQQLARRQVPGQPAPTIGVDGAIVRSVGAPTPAVYFNEKMFPHDGGGVPTGDPERVRVNVDGVLVSFLASYANRPPIPVPPVSLRPRPPR